MRRRRNYENSIVDINCILGGKIKADVKTRELKGKETIAVWAGCPEQRVGRCQLAKGENGRLRKCIYLDKGFMAKVENVKAEIVIKRVVKWRE